MNAERAAPQTGGFLPDLCTPSATLPLVLVAALVALALTVARSRPDAFWSELGRMALLCEFLMLASAAVLCALRRVLARRGVAFASALALTALILVAWAVAEGAFALLRMADEPLPAGAAGHALWVGRIVVVAAVVDALVLRYLYVSAEWRENVRREAASRLAALTARIRPHFLFNALNTAASLVADRPAAAERTLENLAELFRATLEERGTTVPLDEEVAIARRYLAIESQRLGDRLAVDWDVAADAGPGRVPPLLLQTLVENAVTHGIEPARDGGTIRVSARRDGGRLVVVVDNPAGEGNAGEDRHGIGLAGAEARLGLAYRGAALLESGLERGRFVVRVRCPWITQPDAVDDADTDRG